MTGKPVSVACFFSNRSNSTSRNCNQSIRRGKWVPCTMNEWHGLLFKLRSLQTHNKYLPCVDCIFRTTGRPSTKWLPWWLLWCMTHRDDSCSRIFIHRDILAMRLQAITVHDDSSYCEAENQSSVTQIVLGTMQPTTRKSAYHQQQHQWGEKIASALGTTWRHSFESPTGTGNTGWKIVGWRAQSCMYRG